ncbi:peptidylprolyl isomerase [Fusibacter sp. JL216-2]|uniref:peptidylprolyl isomerase n=1 Tax=Fusibacter sp. JL216-2 TaxID=3071453 RepID=UPI003D33A8F6
MSKKISLLIALMVALTGVLVTGCTAAVETSDSDSVQDTSASEQSTETKNSNSEETTSTAGLPNPDLDHPVVTMTIADYGDLKIELYPEVAPNTVNNFISLANSGYYDGVTFHRIIKGFMIQGGDPDGTGAGGPGYAITGEFTDNGFENNIKHTPGVISMARTNNPNSAGSQFFIMHKTSSHLDGAYAAFGKVIEGYDYVDKIAQVETGLGDKPTQPVIMEKLTVELNGYEPSEPVKVE